MHLPKPLYEALPYLYIVFGVVGIVSALYISHWNPLAPLYLLLSVLSMVSGTAVRQARREYRQIYGVPAEQESLADAAFATTR